MRMSRWFVAVVAAVLVGPFVASPALAHDALASSDPPDGAVLEAAPDAIVLEFTGNILDVNPAIEVTGPDGDQLEVGEAQVDGTRVTWDLTGPVPAGELAVVWAVTSQDGHPIDGELSFTVEVSEPAPGATVPESAEPEPVDLETTEPTASPAPSPSSTPQNGSDISSAVEGWFFAGLVVTALAIVAVVLFARRNRDPNGPPGQH